MPYKDGVLATLSRRPGYGYELSRRMAREVPPWGDNKNNIYAALRNLARTGHIVEDIERDSRRDYYEITEAGRRAFEAWMCEPARPAPPVRDDIWAKIAYLSWDTLPGVIEQTRDLERQLLEEAEALSADPDLTAPAQDELDEVKPLILHEVEKQLLEARIDAVRSARVVLTRVLEAAGRSERADDGDASS